MSVLVACEESQSVTIELRNLGIDAYSCDTAPCTGDHPEWHLQQDVLPLLKEKWDMVIAFPPCTHLACSGAKHFAQKKADGRYYQGIGFFLKFTRLKHIKRVAIENPVGVMSNIYKRPTQIIQPYYFGDNYTKTTCLWLKGLPKLIPTVSIADAGEFYISPTGKKLPKWYSDNKSSTARSKTFPGIAKAMALQWSKEL